MTPRPPPAIVVGRYPLDTGAWFPPHAHPRPQVLWSPRGVVGVAVADQQWVLPPTRALWMPGGVVHSTGASRKALVTGIYLSPGHGPPGWCRPTVLAAGPLFAELIGYLARDDLSPRRRGNAETVLLDVLEPLPAAPLEVRIPVDPRAAAVANALREDPADRRGLAGFAQLAGTSPRTLSRLFTAETGTSFERWRATLRMWTALPMLAEGDPVSRVAHAVGYATPSAFLAAFRRTVGMAPGAYLSGHGR